MGEREFGPYRLVQQIAVGGMAELHLAKTSGIAGFEKYVALKMIHPNFCEDEQFIQMLIDEAKITVQLQHVNIAQTFDLGRVGDTFYITMEYVDGADLYKILRKGSERDFQIPVDVCAYIAKEVATGLDYAHRKRDVSGAPLGIVHRDVSPQNVLISHAGEVKLVDFGIAKATMRARQTAVGVIKGKYYYMSPEQAWGDPVDHRSDIFSAGIVLYEMLTGQMLYLEEDLHRLLDIVRKANIAPPTTLRRDIPPQLERIVMHALAKSPTDRYQTAGDLATDLERFLHVYSPVFTASKVSAYVHKVLGEPSASPAIPEEPEAEPMDPGRVTRPVTRDQLVRARSEFTDENSVIFQMKDLGRRPPPGEIDDDTGVTAAEPFHPRMSPPGMTTPPRAAHLATMQLSEGELDEDSDKTIVSEPPGFGGGDDFGRPSLNLDTLQTDDGDSDFDEQPTIAHPSPEDMLASAIDEEGPTRADFDPLLQHRRSPSTSREPAKGKKPLGPPPVPHPALSASTKRPAVSAIRAPRKSQKTPAAGLPVLPPGMGARPGNKQGSLLSAIVGTASDERSPGKPSSIKPPPDGVPRVVMSQESPAPGNRAAPQGAPGQHPVPVAGRPGKPFGPESNVPGQPSHLPLAPPVQTPNPLTPFPTGPPPSSFSRQLAALEIDEIPDAFKLGRSREGSWLLRGALAAICIIGGVILGVTLLGGSDSKAEAKIRFESIPQGAVVTVDGNQLADPTPVVFSGARPGKRYRVSFALQGYHPKTQDVLVPENGGEVTSLVLLERIEVKLIVTSSPKADVFVDSVRKGMTPLEVSFLDPPKTVELRLKGYQPERRSLDWSNQTEITLDIPMKRQRR